MAAQPLTRITGTVHATRVQTWDAGKSEKTGREWKAGSYAELIILTDVSMLAGEFTDVPSTISVRTDEETAATFGRGELVDLYVQPFVDKFQVRGRWADTVGHRLAARVSAARPQLATA